MAGWGDFEKGWNKLSCGLEFWGDLRRKNWKKWRERRDGAGLSKRGSGRSLRSIIMSRKATISRKTAETKIDVFLALDPPTAADHVITVSTGIGFLDHMYTALAKHSGMALSMKCEGDLWIDDHHTADMFD